MRHSITTFSHYCAPASRIGQFLVLLLIVPRSIRVFYHHLPNFNLLFVVSLTNVIPATAQQRGNICFVKSREHTSISAILRQHRFGVSSFSTPVGCNRQLAISIVVIQRLIAPFPICSPTRTSTSPSATLRGRARLIHPHLADQHPYTGSPSASHLGAGTPGSSSTHRTLCHLAHSISSIPLRRTQVMHHQAVITTITLIRMLARPIHRTSIFRPTRTTIRRLAPP